MPEDERLRPAESADPPTDELEDYVVWALDGEAVGRVKASEGHGRVLSIEVRLGDGSTELRDVPSSEIETIDHDAQGIQLHLRAEELEHEPEAERAAEDPHPGRTRIVNLATFAAFVVTFIVLTAIAIALAAAGAWLFVLAAVPVALLVAGLVALLR